MKRATQVWTADRVQLGSSAWQACLSPLHAEILGERRALPQQRRTIVGLPRSPDREDPFRPKSAMESRFAELRKVRVVPPTLTFFASLAAIDTNRRDGPTNGLGRNVQIVAAR